MTELCSSVLWIELVNNETGYSAEEFSKWSVVGEAWFLLTAHS